MVTQSAVIANGTAFVGTTSNEEPMAAYVPPPAWQWSFRGSVVALDVATGAVTWTRPDPLGSRAEAAVSVANGVVFGCNLDYTNGTMYALDSSNGKVLWSFNSGGACNAGPAIADGVVFWDSGSTSGPGPLKLFAFGL
ncbi:PQQ-like beta-propeller repeat protein [Paraburkholderia sp. 31.1]|nr:PQQ-like beta-propeller repeat protein [Paraburkholderia sp. 31.1]